MEATQKDPAEQEMLARSISEELTEIFIRYVRGEVDFAQMTFACYDVLEDLHVVASGEYELMDEDEDVFVERDAAGHLTEEGARRALSEFLRSISRDDEIDSLRHFKVIPAEALNGWTWTFFATRRRRTYSVDHQGNVDELVP